MKKLAIVVTHPIQYYVPVFKLLVKQCDLRVFYTWGLEGAGEKFDPDFKRTIEWDLPLLDGYPHEFSVNTAKKPGSHHYNGIINPHLIQAIKIFEPNAILVYGWSYKSHLKVLKYFKGKIPVWFRGDSNLIDYKQDFKQILRQIFLTWVYRHVDKAFYVGTANKAYYEKFGLKPGQLIFAPHAVDNRRFASPDREQSTKLRAKLSIPPTATVILFAGKLEPKKNPALLLAAFAKIKNRNLHLLFVGNGELEQSLKMEVQHKKIENVHFLDFQNQQQMPNTYAVSDLFCLPSQGPGETWGLAINEAMAAGKAVLASNAVGCATDLVQPGINGEIFQNRDLDDLLSKLNFLVRDPELLRNMGECSMEIIEDWTIEKQAMVIIKELEATYEG